MDSEDLTFDGETVGFQSRATPTGVGGLAGWARAVQPGPLRRADPAEVTAALVQLGRFGPFFAVHLDQPDNTALSVAEQISFAAGRLGIQDRRVAASILFQGMAARLWSPVLGCLATVGIVPDLPAPLQWQLRDGGGVQPCIPHPGGWIATEDARDVAALVGTLRVLQHGVAANHAADDPLTIAVVLRLLDAPPLAGTAVLSAFGKLDEFRRRSCCLYYRIPDGGHCGDCALDRTPTTPDRVITSSPSAKDPG